MLTVKSAIDRNQLQDRGSKGAKYVELQMLPDDIHRELEEMVEVVKESGLTVRSVHPPIWAKCDLEDIVATKESIEKVFSLANIIGEMQGDIITVVMHFEYSLEIYEKLGCTYKVIDPIVGILNRFTNTKMALENLQMVLSEDKVTYRTSTNITTQPVELAEYINRNYNIPHKVGTVLDICHMLSTIRIMRDLGVPNVLDIKDYFEAYKDTLDIVHLANTKGNGLLSSNHGTTFDTEDDMELLRYLLRHLELDKNIVLEIWETDYNNTENWVYTQKLIEDLVEWEL